MIAMWLLLLRLHSLTINTQKWSAGAAASSGKSACQVSENPLQKAPLCHQQSSPQLSSARMA